MPRSRDLRSLCASRSALAAPWNGTLDDPAHDQKDIDDMRKALKQSKGPGNFRNLFLYSPRGKKDGVQIIPVSEVAAKDEFYNIKNITRDDQLAGHRIPPQLMGVVPQNAAGFAAAWLSWSPFLSPPESPPAHHLESFPAVK